MLSRHYLRTKALQTIYGCVVSDNMDPHGAVTSFEHRINRLNDLGIYQLSQLVEMRRTAARVNREVLQKFNPTEVDRNPSQRFENNALIGKLADNYDFRRYSDKLHISWDIYSADFHQLYNTLRHSDLYKTYAASEDMAFAVDRKMATDVFRMLVNNTTLRQLILDRSITWEDDYDQIAQYNFAFMKEMPEDYDEASHLPLMNDPASEKDMEAFEFAKLLVRKTVQDFSANETLIRTYLSASWEYERVAVMDLVIINMAITEFTACPSIPEIVTVDESLELAKEFSAERSRVFVNGILDKIHTDLLRKGLINKTGRGLGYLEEEPNNEEDVNN